MFYHKKYVNFPQVVDQITTLLKNIFCESFWLSIVWVFLELVTNLKNDKENTEDDEFNDFSIMYDFLKGTIFDTKTKWGYLRIKIELVLTN